MELLLSRRASSPRASLDVPSPLSSHASSATLPGLSPRASGRLWKMGGADESGPLPSPNSSGRSRSGSASGGRLYGSVRGARVKLSPLIRPVPEMSLLMPNLTAKTAEGVLHLSEEDAWLKAEAACEEKAGHVGSAAELPRGPRREGREGGAATPSRGASGAPTKG